MNLIPAISLAATILTSQALFGETILVLGDSLSTGAATHPALRVSGSVLAAAFEGQLNLAADPSHLPEGVPARDVTPPVRLYPVGPEAWSGFDWLKINMRHLIGRLYLDTEEYSWAYMLSRELAIPPEKIFFAAEDGARMASGVAQLYRYWDRPVESTRETEKEQGTSQKFLPRYVSVFFSGNDLCGPTLAYMTPVESYRHHVDALLTRMTNLATTHTLGTDVYVIAPLTVTQLLSSDDLLAKKITAYGQEMSCRDMRKKIIRMPKWTEQPTETSDGPPTSDHSVIRIMKHMVDAGIQGGATAYCFSLLGEAAEDKSGEKLQQIAGRLRAYRHELRGAVIAANEEVKRTIPDKPLRFHYVDDTAAMMFAPDDIAADCFHLSPKGHLRIAQTVIKHLQVGPN